MLSIKLPQLLSSSSKCKKKKKSTLGKFLIFSPKKVFLIFQEMDFSSPKIKKVLIFSEKKVFLYFGKFNFFRKLLTFQEKTFRRSQAYFSSSNVLSDTTFRELK